MKKGLIRFTLFLLSIVFITMSAYSSETTPNKMKKSYKLDYLNSTIDTYEIPSERLYTEGKPQNRQMKRENGKLYEYRIDGGDEGWAQHVKNVPKEAKAGSMYIYGAFEPLPPEREYKGGEPKNGDWAIGKNQKYVYMYERAFGWVIIGDGNLVTFIDAKPSGIKVGY